MPKACFCSGCATGLQTERDEKKKTGEKIVPLFRTPQNAELFEKWKAAIPRDDKDLSRSDFVCGLHFSEEDVIKYFEVKLPNGEVWKEEREKPCLRTGAVPHLFPKQSKNIWRPDIERKLSLPGTVEEIEILPDINIDLPLSSEDSPQNCETTSPYLYTTLKKDLSTLKKESWTTTETNESVALLKWENNFSLERWIVITENMAVKVFMKGVMITEDNDFHVTCFNDVVDLMGRVKDLVICTGANFKNPNCRGFLKGNYEIKKTHKCRSCRQGKIKQGSSVKNNKSTMS